MQKWSANEYFDQVDIEIKCKRIFWSSRYVEMECKRVFCSSRYVEMECEYFV